jgi:murein DD-endopeptidase MepM/ murein hydrolase activator NlpD
LINYYSFDIDFQRDIKKNDWFEVVFEAFYSETGKNIKNGNIIYANLHVNRSDHKIYKFEHNGTISYFDDNGLSTQKSLLKTPIDGARISSRYSKGRKHPVLGYTRAHKGIDFAAPVGTPFYAAGAGTVEKVTVGCKNGDKQCGGGYGNYVLIKHNNTYSTEYAHISRVVSNIKVGTRVRQGQTIAYVGTTGLSTGPHLHYGVIFKGERINPATVRSIPLTKLSGKSLLNFLEERERINMLRSSATNQNVASSLI